MTQKGAVFKMLCLKAGKDDELQLKDSFFVAIVNTYEPGE
jgi:hypothetical protein